MHVIIIIVNLEASSNMHCFQLSKSYSVPSRVVRGEQLKWVKKNEKNKIFQQKTSKFIFASNICQLEQETLLIHNQNQQKKR